MNKNQLTGCLEVSIALIIVIIITSTYIYFEYFFFRVDSDFAAEHSAAIEKYLKEKYSINTKVIKYKHPIEGYYKAYEAHVVTIDNSPTDIIVYDFTENFSPYNTLYYLDNYMENYLLDDAKNKIQPILDKYFDDYNIQVYLDSPSDMRENDYLYNKYKNIQIPISWDSKHCDEILSRIWIGFSKEININSELKKEIDSKINATNVKFKKIEWDFEGK